MAEQVKILTKFRDDVLLTNTLGKSFVTSYYEVSPSMADFIAKHDYLRVVVRWSLLPVLGVSWIALKLGVVPTVVLVLFLFALVTIAINIAYKHARSRVH
jgi:hypothetical protein